MIVKAPWSPVLIALAVLGLAIGISRIREIWRNRGDTSRHARYLRVRYAVFSVSLVGFVLISLVQLFSVPLWVADVGMGVIFASWGGFVILSIVLGFVEGFRAE